MTDLFGGDWPHRKLAELVLRPEMLAITETGDESNGSLLMGVSERTDLCAVFLTRSGMQSLCMVEFPRKPQTCRPHILVKLSLRFSHRMLQGTIGLQVLI
jgi:hypothetical protein